MWPFSKRYSIAESGLLNGMTDYHCHILPGVDDGVKMMEESLQVLSQYEKSGIREVWLTPHIMEDMPNETEFLKTKFRELKSSYTGKIILHLSAENMLDNLFERRLSTNDLLTLGDDTHLLVETSYFNPPMGLHNILLRIRTQGYTPLLAHPERYMYMDKDDYAQLKEKNVKFQLNLMSLVGAYGPQVRIKAEWLLKNKYYDVSGSDLHSLIIWKEAIGQKELSEGILQQLPDISSPFSSIPNIR